MRENQTRSLGREDPLENGMATHSSTLAWRIPWTEEPGGLQSVGSQGLIQLSNYHFHFLSLSPASYPSDHDCVYPFGSQPQFRCRNICLLMSNWNCSDFLQFPALSSGPLVHSFCPRLSLALPTPCNLPLIPPGSSHAFLICGPLLRATGRSEARLES